MKKIEMIINKSGLRLSKTKATKFLSDYYTKTAKQEQDITLRIKSELDFFNAAILIESLKNKRLFEETYERERKELTDLWPTLSYLEKNKLINLKINETKKRCKQFTSEKGTRIWIAFFDELLNTLYDKEMNIFDLDQYFNLYKDFKKRMIPLSTYGVAPFRDEFIDINMLQFSEKHVIFYYEPIKTVFSLSTEKIDWTLKKLCLKDSYLFNEQNKDKLINLMYFFEENKPTELMNEFLNSDLISDKVRKDLLKMRKKQQ